MEKTSVILPELKINSLCHNVWVGWGDSVRNEEGQESTFFTSQFRIRRKDSNSVRIH